MLSVKILVNSELLGVWGIKLHTDILLHEGPALLTPTSVKGQLQWRLEISLINSNSTAMILLKTKFTRSPQFSLITAYRNLLSSAYSREPTIYCKCSQALRIIPEFKKTISNAMETTEKVYVNFMSQGSLSFCFSITGTLSCLPYFPWKDSALSSVT